MRKLAIPSAVLVLVAVVIWLLSVSSGPGPDVTSWGRLEPGEERQTPGPESAELPVQNLSRAVADDSIREPEGPSETFKVAVVDEEWEPLAEATVTLLAFDDTEHLYLSDVKETTDDTGCTVFRLDPGERLENFLTSNGDFAILAQKQGYAPSMESVWSRGKGDRVIELRRSVRIEGRVLEFETHAPVSGARLLFGEEFNLGPGSPSETVTAEDGSFRLESVPLEDSLVLTVIRPGHMFWQHVVEEVHAEGNWIEILVPRGKTLMGRAVDADTGEAVPGVRIGTHHPIAVSDASGRFQVNGLWMDQSFATLDKTGYCRTCLITSLEEFDESGEVVFPMFRACSVEGVVVDADGTPVAGARVSPEWLGLLTTPDPLAGRYPQFEWDKLLVFVHYPRLDLHTDNDGKFRYPGLKVSSHPVRLHVEHPGGPRTVSTGWLRFSKSGECRQVVLRYGKGSVIEGTVRPAGPAWRIVWTGATMRGMGGAGVDGRYRLEGVAAGEVRLDVFGEGPQDRVPSDEDESLVTDVVRVGAAPVYWYDINLPADGLDRSVAGTVVRPDGSPAADVQVSVMLSARCLSCPKTDAQGRFEIWVPARKGTSCRVHLVSGSGLSADSPDAKVGDRDLLLVFPASEWVRLQIIDADNGQPLPRATIRWEMNSGMPGVPVHGSEEWAPRRDGTDGAIALPIGSITLTVKAPALGYPPHTLENFQVGQGPSEPTRTIRLQRKH
ncbi:MAG: carboxypeptidase-like regulatory domain-containing protein [Planctomycetota bacterium]